MTCSGVLIKNARRASVSAPSALGLHQQLENSLARTVGKLKVTFASVAVGRRDITFRRDALATRATANTLVLHAMQSIIAFLRHKHARRARILLYGAARIARRRSLRRVCVALTSMQTSAYSAIVPVSNTRGGLAQHQSAIGRFVPATIVGVSSLRGCYAAAFVGLQMVRNAKGATWQQHGPLDNSCTCADHVFTSKRRQRNNSMWFGKKANSTWRSIAHRRVGKPRDLTLRLLFEC